MNNRNERNSEKKTQVKKHFAAMAASYFLGSFNDNFYKQAISLIAVQIGLMSFQGYALMAFTLPFVLFASVTGWFSDRYPKRRIVIVSKWIELLAVIVGSVGILIHSWPLMMTMLFIMGTQASLFSPAINGAIPELFEGNNVVKANGVFRMSVMIAIFLGIGLAGVVLDIPGNISGFETGRILLSIIILLLAVVGVIISYNVFSKESADPEKPFPWTGPFDTLKVLYSLRKDTLLICAVLLDIFIWCAGSIQILLLNPLGMNQMHFSKTSTSLLLVSQLLGIGIGGLLSSKFTNGKRWYMVLIPAGTGMALFMAAIGMVPHLPEIMKIPCLFAFVGLVGLFGGLFMIPLESFIQMRPAADMKGTVWASSNFLTFIGILLSGLYGNLLNKIMLPTSGFIVMGVFTVIITASIAILFKRGNFE